MVAIPPPKNTDVEDVAWGLQTAEALWKRGERGDAIVWLRRAATAAGEATDDDRALELARSAAELSEWVATNPASVNPEAPPEVAPVASSLMSGQDGESIDVQVDLDVEDAPPSDGPTLAVPPVEPPSHPASTLSASAEKSNAPDPRSSESVLPAERVHAGMFNPWEDAPPPPPQPAPAAPVAAAPRFADEEEEVVTSVRPQQVGETRAEPVGTPIVLGASLAETTQSRPPDYAAAQPTDGQPKTGAPPLPKPSMPSLTAQRPLPPPLPPRANKSGMMSSSGMAAVSASPVPSASSSSVVAAAASVPPLPSSSSSVVASVSVPPLPSSSSSSVVASVSVPPLPSSSSSSSVAAPRPRPSTSSVTVPRAPRPSTSSVVPAPRAPRTSSPSVVSSAALPSSSSAMASAVPAALPSSPVVSSAALPSSAVEVAPGAELPAALDLESVEAFADLPDDARSQFAAAARVSTLAEGEEVSDFALAYVVSGTVDVAATMVDAPAARLAGGSVLRSRGTMAEGVPMRLIGVSGGIVATWSDAAVADAFRTCPWVEEDLRTAADRLQTLVGVTIGPLGERLDPSIREQIIGRLTMRTLLAGDIVVTAGEAVPGLLLVGVGELELVAGEKVTGVVGSGEFLFPGEVLGAGAAPLTARAAPGGALILFGDRMIAQELLVTCPPLLEVFAGM